MDVCVCVCVRESWGGGGGGGSQLQIVMRSIELLAWTNWGVIGNRAAVGGTCWNYRSIVFLANWTQHTKDGCQIGHSILRMVVKLTCSWRYELELETL